MLLAIESLYGERAALRADVDQRTAEIERLQHGIYRQARAMYDASLKPVPASPPAAPRR